MASFILGIGLVAAILAVLSVWLARVDAKQQRKQAEQTIRKIIDEAKARRQDPDYMLHLIQKANAGMKSRQK